MLAAPAGAACRLEPRADVPVRVIEGFPIVPARVGGTPVSLLLDTGAQGNLLLPEAAAALGLRPTPGATARMFGTGGAVVVPTVMLDRLSLGGVALPAAATPVAALPGAPATAPMLAGLLGAGMLSRYDVDLNVPAGRVALYDADSCPGLPELGARTTVLPLTVTDEREAFLPVQVDGVTVMALLDTGSRATLLTQRVAKRLGLGGAMSANTARGVDGERMSLQHTRVREMRVGADVRSDVPVSIADLQIGRGEMLLGLDYLGQRRVWISYATGRIVIGLPSPGASGR